MAQDIIPGSFWCYPAFRLPSLWDDEEEMALSTGVPSGLSISEDGTHVYVEAAIPGVNPDDIEVTFNKGVLWIKAESKEEKSDKKYYRRATSSFSYHVAVPGDLDLKKEPDATYKNGVMKVAFAKSTASQPKRIQVKSGK